MKKAIFLVLLTATIMGGCKKEEDKTPVATCSDGIQNQGETGVDCGGPCTACLNPSMACKIDGASWSVTNITNTGSGDNKSFSATSDGKRITINFHGSTTGTYDFGGLANLNMGSYVIGSIVYNTTFGGSGSLIITSYTNNVISGTFSFVGGTYPDGATTATITEGTFTDVKLN